MAENKRSSNTKNNIRLDGPGPYLARVINNIDPERMGSLEVELLRTVGNSASTEQQLFTVRYCSPFYGVTDIYHNTPNTNYDYNETQKSYGFWMVPPDTGTIVMVMFVDGMAGEGYWFGCVPDKNMNYMIPGIAGSKSIGNVTRNQNEETWFSEKAQAGRGGGQRVNPGGGEIDIGTFFEDAEMLPVAEYNKMPFRENKGNSYNADADLNIKPVHPIAFNIARQGLIKDPVRGVHTSSARRETPSNVFGISTPGPIDKRDGAQKGEVGKRGAVVTKFVSRLGGTTLVMDDGNDKRLRKSRPHEGPMEYADLEKNEEGGLVDLPEDEGFRIRTRTGHQILMSNSEDLIYINNSRGTAWIELTSNGKIDIYAQDSVSIHSEVDLNFVADRDINLTAGANINIAAASHIKGDAGQRAEFNTGDDFQVSANGNATLDARVGVALAAHSNLSLTAVAGDFKAYAGGSGSIVTDKHFGLAANQIGLGANGDVSVNSTANILMSSYQYENQTREGGHFVNANGPVSTKTTGSFYHEFTGDFHIKAANIAFDADEINLNSGVATASIAMLNEGAYGHAPSTSSTAVNMYPASPPGNDPGVESPDTPDATTGSAVAARIPMMEPWLQHENLNPQFYTPDKTRAGTEQIDSYGPNQGSIGPNNEESRDIPTADADGDTGDNEGGDGTNPDSPGAPGGSGLTPNAKKAMDFFIKQKGYTVAQAAAIVGNLQQESYAWLDHNAQNNVKERSWGLAQWNRKGSPDRFLHFQQKFGRDLEGSSFDQQLEFIHVEMTEGPTDAQAKQYYNVYHSKTKENTADAAEKLAQLFHSMFERSEKASTNTRKQNARTLFEEYIRGRDGTGNAPEDDPSKPPPPLSELPRDKGTDGVESPVVDSNSQTQPDLTTAENSPDTQGSEPGTSFNKVMFSMGVRNKRPSDSILKIINGAAHDIGLFKVVVISGAQPGSGIVVQGGKCGRRKQYRTGTGRHDTGHAVDVELHPRSGGGPTSNGNTIKQFMMACARRGAKGFGYGSGYMPLFRIHIDTLGATISIGRNPGDCTPTRMNSTFDRKTITFWKSGFPSSWKKDIRAAAAQHRDGLKQ